MAQKGDIACGVFEGDLLCDSNNALFGLAHQHFGLAYDMEAIPDVVYIRSTDPGCLEVKRSTARDGLRRFTHFRGRTPALIQLFSDLQVRRDVWEPIDHFSFQAASVIVRPDQIWVPRGGGAMQTLEVLELRGIEEFSFRQRSTLPG